MEITEIRVKLADNHQERLLAFCTITLDHAFVVRDVKVIDGPRGPFVAMPSRKVTSRCPRCGEKNHLRANYCNSCGERMSVMRAQDDGRGRPRLYVDIAHPINQECRTLIEKAAIHAFQSEQHRARQPGYVAPDLDDFEDAGPESSHESSPSSARRKTRKSTRGQSGDEEGELQAS